MGKLFGYPPHKYFDTDNQYINLAIDIACATAHWEDENYRLKESKETAQEEASMIGASLDRIREELEGQRG